ncbi:hypothetical protein SCLCIDRAFT_24432 [Scleroderma citrinum Foug A]|uniref:Uncharacterized protein n=1 Tax=Scleroderma citrinum Foug A TaxID=1036808 RepID=A0A0C3AEC1_9AGAM|nr:hypothetical protein SCLCIDRAFT_24432 [Scleroderma citrinum Foug A]
MALIRGIMSNFPCPVCLIPREQISKFPDPYPLRTSENIAATLEKARCQQLAEDKERILAAEGLRDVDNAFRTVSNTDVHHALSMDRLHTNNAGKFGHHQWPELQKILERMGRSKMAKVEENLCLMPHWHGLNHFKEALSVSYTDSQKFEDLSKVIVFACHDVLTREECKDGYILLHCLRAYIEFDLYTAFEVHTTHTLTAGREALSTLNTLIQLRTNFKDVADQILRIDHYQLVAEHIHCKIEDHDTYYNSMTGVVDDEEHDTTEDYFHVRLGSAQKPLTFQGVEQNNANDKAFEQFRIKLNLFLNSYFQTVRGSLPQGRPIQFKGDDTVIEYCYVKVNFESKVDWCQYTDYLHCSPSFHGQARHDCAIFRTQQHDIFGRIVFLFTCSIDKEKFPLALVHPYDAGLVGQRLSKDSHLGFWRVREQSRASTEIFSVHLIIRGALLYPDNARPGEYLVIDTIDTDMFLCVQEMHKSAGHY